MTGGATRAEDRAWKMPLPDSGSTAMAASPTRNIPGVTSSPCRIELLPRAIMSLSSSADGGGRMSAGSRSSSPWNQCCRRVRLGRLCSWLVTVNCRKCRPSPPQACQAQPAAKLQTLLPAAAGAPRLLRMKDTVAGPRSWFAGAAGAVRPRASTRKRAQTVSRPSAGVSI